MYCHNTPYGQAADASGNLSTCGTQEYYNPATGACETCPTGQVCDKTTGNTSTCQAGEYIDESVDPRTCEECEAGKFCKDGANRENVGAPQFSLDGYAVAMDCPPAYSCTTNSNTACTGAGEYSLAGENVCTEEDYFPVRSLEGTDCPV